MAEQPQRLKWIHARGWQVFLAAFVLVSVVFLVLSVASPDGVTAGLVFSTLSLVAALLSSVLGRRQITGRW